jgi:Fe-S-cluster containining protein
MSWKCKKCGECCKFFSIPYVNLTVVAREYLEMHGVGIDRETERLIIPARCKHLTEDNKCNIYGNRPDGCKAAGKRECAEAKRRYGKITETKQEG